jgi:hypothetical protein
VFIVEPPGKTVFEGNAFFGSGLLQLARYGNRIANGLLERYVPRFRLFCCQVIQKRL